MAERIIKLPDVGEGIAEAELVEWHIKVGDIVREDDLLAAVMTDKATVEIPAPTDGEVTWIGAEGGDTVPIGSVIVKLKGAGEGEAAAEPASDTLGPHPEEPQSGVSKDVQGGSGVLRSALRDGPSSLLRRGLACWSVSREAEGCRIYEAGDPAHHLPCQALTSA